MWKEVHDVQYPQQKHAGQRDFLSLVGVQAPDHWDWKAKNEDIGQEVEDTADNSETRQVDARCTLHLSVPEGCHRSALKDACQSEADPLAKDNTGA